MTSGRLTRALVAGALIPAGVTAGLVTAAAAASSPPPGGIISTIAGGPGGPDSAASVSVVPCGLKFSQGQLYIGDGTAVHRVSQSNGRLIPVVGTGSDVGSTADGVPADIAAVGPEDAAIPGACGVATDPAGNVLLADGSSVRVVAAKTGTYYRHKMTAGDIYTVANGFNDAVDVELSPAGIVVADEGNQASHTDSELDALIHVVAERTGTYYGQKMTAGKTYVVAGNTTNGVVGNGIPATRVDLGVDVGATRLDSGGNLVVADTGGGGPGPFGNGGASVPPGVRVVAARSGTFYGQKMKAGYIYTIAGGQSIPVGNGVPGTRSGLASANGVALDSAGNVVIADGQNVRVVAARSGTFYGQKMKADYLYAIAGSGTSTGPYSGDGGPAAKAVFDATGVAVDGAGNVFIADNQNFRVLAVAGRPGSYYGRKMTTGHIYSVAGNGRDQDSGNGGPATSSELTPSGVAECRAGDFVVMADDSGSVVRVAPARTGMFYGQPMKAGDIYTIAGDGTAGFSGDGGPAVKASLRYPGGVAADQAGNVLVADVSNNRVRVVAARTGTFYGRPMKAGDIYTIAGDGIMGFSGDGGPAAGASMDEPTAVTTDRAGNVLVTDSRNYRVRVVAASTGTFYGRPMKAGDIDTIAGDGTAANSGYGGPATAAGISPAATAVDGAGNVLIGDSFNGAVWVVPGRSGTYYQQKMTAGDIYLIAGRGAAKALPGGAGPVAIDSAGNVLVSGEFLVQALAESDGTYYGQKMTKGDVYTIAGGGILVGDGGPATRADIGFYDPLAIGYSGNLLLADPNSARIRSVSR